MKKLCIYHGNCADGFGAAWVVRKALGEENVDFHAGVYQQAPPDVTGRDVILVDFSYKRPVLLKMAETANSILIIDHHKTAAKDLVNIEEYLDQNLHCYIECKFSMEHSGAMLTWFHFFPNTTPPTLLAHIQDRDLWKFELPGTREIQANLFSYPYDFDVWDDLVFMCEDLTGWQTMRTEGAAIERKHFKDINEFIEAAKYHNWCAGYFVPMLNAPYFWSSDAGHIMGKGEPFAVCYWDTPEGRIFSLRSDKDFEHAVDVAEIAAKFGGGGHKHAAGFKLKYDELDKITGTFDWE